ncbi:DUF6383 domain-containing protein [Parabacteroides sp.]
MNKKLSLTLAAFVAAGFSLTAEAGVIKVAAPQNGQQYIIADQTNGALLDKAYPSAQPLVLTGAGGTVAGANAANDVQSTQTANIWTVANGANGGFQLGQEVSGVDKFIRNNGGLTFDVVLPASFKYNTPTNGGKIVILDADGNETVSNGLLTLASGSATLAAGTAVDFYAITKKYLSETTSAQVVKIFGKYLVVTDATAPTVKLVSEQEYNAYKTLEPANVTWTVNSDGILVTSNTSISNKQLKLTNAAGTIGLTLANAGTVLEANTDLQLLGFTDGTSGKFTQWTGAASGVELDNSTATYATLTAAGQLVNAATQVSVTTAAYATSPIDVTVFEGLGYERASSLNEGGVYIGFFKDPTDETQDPLFITKDSEKAAATGLEVTAGLDQDVLAKAEWTIKNNADGTVSIYRVEAGETVNFTVGSVNKFYLEGNYQGFYLYTKTGVALTPKQYVKYTPAAGGVPGYYSLNTAATAPNGDAYFTVFTGKANYFKVSELNYNQGNNFTLDIVSGVNDKALQGNFFNGRTIVAVQPTYNTSGFVTGFEDADATADQYMLRDAQTGEFIVLDMYDQWSAYGINQHITDGGYKFTTIKEAKTMINYLNKVGMQNMKLEVGYLFKIAYTSNNKNNIKFIEVSYQVNSHTEMAGLVGTYYLVNYNSNGSDYLTVNKVKKDLVKASFGSSLVVTGDMEVSPFAWRYVNMAFANNPSVVYYAESGKYVGLNGKVVGIHSNALYAAAKDEDQFLFSKPEGQWAVLVDDSQSGKDHFDKIGLNAVTGKETSFVLVNRENPSIKIEVNKMYKLAENKYVFEYLNSDAQFARAKDANGNYVRLKRDTMMITPAPEFAYGEVAMDGYSVYTTEMLKNKLYRLALNSTVDDYYVAENHGGNHLLGLVRTPGEAVNWELIPMTKARELDKDGFLKSATDSVYVINNSQSWNAKKERYDQTADTLAMVAYVLRNTANGEYLRYEGNQTQSKERMMCDPNSKNAQTKDLDAAYRFVLKQKDGEIINIVGVANPKKSAYNTDTWFYKLDLGNKLYGATTESRGSVEVEGAYSQINSNDRFYLELVNADQYKTMALNDTVRIYREKNNYDVMFENGQFLNLGNIVSEPTIKPAMLIDTAYVARGENNTRPQYLLVVNPNYVPAIYDNKDHLIEPDTMYGRFLVNQIDSAVWENKYGKIHNNKFINDTEADETYVKLSFQYGFHTGDKLYLTDKNFVKTGKAGDVIDLSTADFNKAKFAFKYVNPEAAAGDPTESFKIQTRYIDYKAAINGGNSQTNEGYLKTINGVVVVTDAYDKGEEFNLTGEISAPTANDNVTVGEVSVVATDGAVIVKGAEGKAVVITNVLGQTIANAVISSNEATIAVPAGVVIVAVEGEDAVKAIVK